MGTTVTAELEALEQAHDKLNLRWEDVGAIIGVNESTIHRWRKGTAEPRPMARTRLVQLKEILELLRTLFDGPDLARAWLREHRAEGLGGSTPIAVMEAGRMDRVVVLLTLLARGG